MKRTLALTLVFVLLAWPAAGADYRGSDVLGNIGPSSQVEGGLADKYPLSAYALDYQVQVGVTDPDGVPAMIAQWAAAQLWDATSLLVKCTIDLFAWAFSLDLLNGADGALAPISAAITSLYENVIGQAWMVVAILLAGIWAIWKALVQRRYTETAGALGVSVLFVLVALFFVYQPERTVGQASQWTNTVSLAFLSGANRGSLDDPEQAKRQVSDHLFETLLYKPWVVLEFGGLAHCVDIDRTDADGFPRPVAHDDPARDVCRNHLKPDRAGYGGYAERFLKHPPGSKERKLQATAIRDGELPLLIRAAGRPGTDVQVDKSDAPAVDIQQEGGAFQRLTFAVVVAIGALGAVALLGFLSLAVILAQIVALVLLGFAPIALVIGILPGSGHAFFRAWLSKLATAIFIKAVYSLVIAIVVAVSAALTAATGALGFLFAFGLQTIFFWAIFLYRKQIAGRIVYATVGNPEAPRPLPRPRIVRKGADAAARPFSALAGMTHSTVVRYQQKSAVGSDTDQPTTSDPGTDEQTTDPTSLTVVLVNGQSAPRSDRSGRPPGVTPGDPLSTSSTLQQASSNGTAPATPNAPNGHDTVSPETSPSPAPPQNTPRAAHEDAMRRARDLRQQRENPPTDDDHA